MSDLQSDSNMTDDQKEEILCNQLKEITLDNNLSEEEVIELIVNNLQEKNKELISKIVKVIGVKKAMIIYNQTLQIEESGGLKREDGKGKKTPGGVFFYVIYHNQDLFDDNLKRVFSEESQRKEKQRRLQVKEERKRKTELLKAKFIEEGLLSVENKIKETKEQNKNVKTS